ncbi:ribose ABC transport system ATP-binding protein RbsA [Vibrio variabilis]|uniref:Ribose ABC transport system ATP-binding protein RbsA n=1 Tax=Vibrio variabilis TaxID=990271 RepID=A0ABQ0JPS4_9VIBR|nr:ribose ABC transport system ATP-binding protein RbsA [Vibrio variabilis]
MLNLDIDCNSKVEQLTAEEKQLVEIVKACSKNPKILLMDEPTTALRQGDVERLFDLMKTLKSRGCSVVFISHRLKEVMEICDRISIIVMVPMSVRETVQNTHQTALLKK